MVEGTFQHKPYDIEVNKTKLTKDMLTNKFIINRYELKRADCLKVGKKPGGGCAIYIRDNTIFEEKPELIPYGLEGNWRSSSLCHI